jgi:DNA-binding transcriptional LysR family regulator
MPRGRKPRDQGSSWTSPDDIALYLEICRRLESTKSGVTLQFIAKQMGRPLSTVSQALARLEARYHCELIERGARVGIGSLTGPGKNYRDLFEKAMRALRDIEIGRETAKPEDVVIVSTNALRNHLLSGPVAAHVMRLRMEGNAEKFRIRIDEKDYPDIVNALREGKYPYAIGWQLGNDWYGDLEMKDLHRAVPFGAIIGHPQVRGTVNDALSRCFRVQEEMNGPQKNTSGEWDEAENNHTSVRVEELAGILEKYTVVVLKNEYDETLRKHLPYEGLAKFVFRVDHYEDVLSSVRMGLADLGWVPVFYQPRRYVHFRLLRSEETPLCRNVVEYRRKPLPHDNPAAIAPIENRAAEDLLETVKRFLRAKEFAVGQQIDPREIEKWVKREWGLNDSEK